MQTVPHDYISPNLQQVALDFAFPNMAPADPTNHVWPHLRREIPHRWYVDQRSPGTGFLNCDEVHLLYNSALQARGRNALEIGCWLGWSAAHLMLAGVHLDVVDPVLGHEAFQQSIIQSLNAVAQRFTVQTRVQLHAATSPQFVEHLGQQGSRWSFFFIDGDHEAQAPLQDAIVCARYAEPDAIMLFHDLAAPAVGAGLDYLRDSGWNTVVYQTMQIMGAACRGSFTPIEHRPDPTIEWVLPAHLRGYRVSGG